MTIAIIHDDSEIFVSLTPEEFVAHLNKGIDKGKTGEEIIEQCVRELKRRSLTA